MTHLQRTTGKVKKFTSLTYFVCHALCSHKHWHKKLSVRYFNLNHFTFCCTKCLNTPWKLYILDLHFFFYLFLCTFHSHQNNNNGTNLLSQIRFGIQLDTFIFCVLWITHSIALLNCRCDVFFFNWKRLLNFHSQYFFLALSPEWSTAELNRLSELGTIPMKRKVKLLVSLFVSRRLFRFHFQRDAFRERTDHCL